jgi:CMP-N-acetylneuraminic acid synthetase
MIDPVIAFKEHPLVTVYITNYNYAHFIKQSIESVLNQTLKNIELLIIDDGSTDDSKSIIEEYAALPFVKVIYQQNKGLNVTNNIALRAANGKYLVRLDADDFFEPDALAQLCTPLEKDETLGLVFPDYFLVDEHGNKTGEVIRHDFSNEVSLLDQPAHGACTLIRRKFLLELGGYNEDYTCQDGYELWIKFIAHYKVQNINKPLFNYRQHGNNLTSNEERILSTRMRIKENFVDIRNVTLPKTAVVIPIRSTFIQGEKLPLIQLGSKTILQRLAEEANAAKNVLSVVVTSSDAAMEAYVKEECKELGKVRFVRRPEALERINESLSKTYQLILDQLKAEQLLPEAILSLAVEFPFVDRKNIEDAIRTLSIFSADSVVSVRPDNATYYSHTGSGMQSILNQSQYTKLEREMLYKGAGGLALSTVSNFEQHNRLVAGKVSHIVVDQRTGLSINSTFDLSIARYLAEMPVV